MQAVRVSGLVAEERHCHTRVSLTGTGGPWGRELQDSPSSRSPRTQPRHNGPVSEEPSGLGESHMFSLLKINTAETQKVKSIDPSFPS